MPKQPTRSPETAPTTENPVTADSTQAIPDESAAAQPREYGGSKGLEPTRYGDWEKNGRCIDF